MLKETIIQNAENVLKLIDKKIITKEEVREMLGFKKAVCLGIDDSDKNKAEIKLKS